MIKHETSILFFESLKSECLIPFEAVLRRTEKRIIERNPNYEDDFKKESAELNTTAFRTNTTVWVGTYVNEQSVWELTIDNDGKLIRKKSTF